MAYVAREVGAIVVGLDTAGGFGRVRSRGGVDVEGVEVGADLLDGCKVLEGNKWVRRAKAKVTAGQRT